MSLSSLNHFVGSLDKLHLLAAAQRAELERDLLPRLAQPKALATEMLRRGWLTAYQANQLLQGNHAGLRLGQYVFLERLGEGGTGQVFKARHLHMNRVVALKIIRPELTVDAEVVSRFYREIQVISQLNHPNIIHAFDAGPEGAMHTLVMEYVEGIDLAKLVKHDGPLPSGQACDYVRQAACGLEHAHRKGLIHRDIKPSNLFLTQAHGLQPAGIVKILDLGLARLQRGADGELTSTLTPVGSVTMGTPDYLAPEQALNFHQVDIRADIYSLGCTLFFLLTGQPPFPGGSLAQKILRHQQAAPPRLETMVPNLPPALPSLVYRMLAKLPDERFQTPAELAAALERVTGTSASAGEIAAFSTGTVPDWKNETPPRAEIVPAARPSVGYDATVKESIPAAVIGATVRGARRRPLLLASLGGLALVALLSVGLLAAGRGKSRTSQAAPAVVTAAPRSRLDRLRGQVFFRKGEVRQPIRLGAELQPGQQLEVAGTGSVARLNRDDRILLELGPGASLVELPAENGTDELAWRLKMEPSGTVHGELRKSAGSLALLSTFGEVKFSSQSRFHLAATPQTSWLRVDDGTGELRQVTGAQAIRVPGGHYARFGPSASAVVQPLAAAVKLVEDFEKEAKNWWAFGGEGSIRLARRWVSPGKVGKQALRVDYDFGPTLTHAGLCFYTKPEQDWSDYRWLRFWFYGGQSNNVVQLWVWTQKGTQKWSFKDDFTGWREICPALTDLLQGDGKPSRPDLFRGVSQIDFRVHTTGKGSFQIDQIELLEHEILR